MHHLLDDAGLDLVVKGVDGQIGSRTHYVKSGVEVVGPMRENEGACVDEPEGEM